MISIIVPVYNVEKYLDQCVSSIVNQRYRDLEIILVDDGSPDNCPHICEEWSNKDNRIKVVHKKNGGLSSARNAGIEVAKGEFIGFVDSDDFIDETMFEDLFDIMLKNEKNIIVSSPILKYNNGKVTQYQVGSYKYLNGSRISISEYMKLILDLSIDATVWNKLFRRDFIKTKFLEGRNNEDYLFMYNNLKHIYNADCYVALSGNSHYYYRSNPNSICKQAEVSVKRLFFDELYNINEIYDDLNKWNPSLKVYLYPLMDSKIIVANDQILKWPILQKKRFNDCLFVDEILNTKVPLFRKGRTFSCALKLFLFKYFPNVYLFRSKIKSFLIKTNNQ